MINFYSKQLRWAIIYLIMFLIEEYSTLSLCPGAMWQINATTVAGSISGIPGYNSSTLNRPTDIYISNNSVTYVLDAGNYRAQYIFSNSTIETTVVNGSNGTELNQFSSMNAMSIDINGSIYILDGDNGRVTKWMQGSSFGTLVAGNNGIGNNTNQINSATGMFIDTNTLTIWIADTGNHRIVKWSSSMTSEIVCGNYGSNADQFKYPSGLFIDISNSNILYVADTYNHRIQRWLPGSTNGTTVAGITNNSGSALNQLWFPKSLLVDNNQNMFIVDTYNNRILKWILGESSGIVIAGDITFGTQSNQLNNPMSINFDSNGSLFVVDTFNNRIQKFRMSCPAAAVVNTSTTATSSITTTTISTSTMNCPLMNWATNAVTIAGSSDGTTSSAAANLYNPKDVFVDRSNTIFVLDSGNTRVQRFTLNSTIGTTILNGTGGSLFNQFSYFSSISGDLNGNIYILDRGNTRVSRWTSDGLNGTIVAGGNVSGSDANQLSLPNGIFIDVNTLFIWIADTGNSRIVRWESPSTGIIVCGSNGTNSDQFFKPFGLFVNTTDSNTFYVADTYNHRVQRWLPGATNGTTVAGQTGVSGSSLNLLYYPISILGDTNRNLYILNYGSDSVIRLTVGATYGVIVAGSLTTGISSNQLNGPYNVKFDSSGSLIVADTFNNRIQKFSVICGNMMNTTITTTLTNGLTSSPSPSTTRQTSISTSSSSSSTRSSNAFMVSNSSTTMSTTTISRVSWASINQSCRWLLTIFCSVIILMNN